MQLLLPNAYWKWHLGHKPDRLVKVNLHITNIELMQRHRENKQHKAN